MIIGIMACDPTGAIAYQDQLPWNIPEDIEFFRKTVMNQMMIMGRKTYELLPSAIIQNSPQVLVFSRHALLPPLPSNVKRVASLQQFVAPDKKMKYTSRISRIGLGGESVTRRHVCTNTLEALETKSTTPKLERRGVYMIGGAEIAHLFLDNNLIDEFLLTITKTQYPGDTYLCLEKFSDYSYSVVYDTDTHCRIKFLKTKNI